MTTHEAPPPIRENGLEGDPESDREERPRRRRARLWVAAGAVGLGVAATLGTAWVFRIPLASSLIRGQLAAQGVESQFRIARLDFGAALLADLRLGPEAEPTLAAREAEIAFSWRGPFLPAITALRVESPVLRAALSETGLSFGQLDALLDAPPSGRRPQLPDWAIDIEGGAGLLDTPFGAVPLTFESQGRLGRNFLAALAIPAISLAAGPDTLTGAEGRATLASTAEGLVLDADLAIASLVRRDFTAEALRLEARVSGPNDLSTLAIRAAIGAANARTAAGAAENLTAELDLSGATQQSQLAFAEWNLRAGARADSVAMENAALSANALSLAGAGDANAGRINWRFANQGAQAYQWQADALAGEGALALLIEDHIALDVTGALTAPNARLNPQGRANLMRAWPELGGTPLAPLLQAGGAGAERALRDFSFTAPFAFTLRNGASQVLLSRPIEARAQTGAIARLRPLRDDAAMVSVRLADGVMDMAAVLELSGAGLPEARLTIDDFSNGEGEPTIAAGTLSIPDWQAGGARLVAPELQTRFTLRENAGELSFAGPVLLSGPAGAASVRDLSVPLDLVFGFGEGFRVSTANDACLDARFAALALPGMVFQNGAAAICPSDAGFFAANAQSGVSGGFSIADIALAGHMEGEPAQRARLQSTRITGRFSGDSRRMILDVEAAAPRLTILMEPTREIAVTGARVAARSISADGTWRADGTFENGVLEDPALPAHVTNIAARFTAEPRGNDALIRFTDGAALLTDKPPPDPPLDRRVPFNPIELVDVGAELIGGRLLAQGRFQTAPREGPPPTPALPLGVFEATHVLETAAGEAHVRIRDLQFVPGLQPYMISELARGVVENVSGPMEVDVDMVWAPELLTAAGRVAFTDLSLSSFTLPLIRGVTGEIVFDDLFTLSTPPGQRVHIGELNPGILVRDGEVDFQLLGDGSVRLEGARWPFAQGTLSVKPTTIMLGTEETRFSLLLRDVDVASLLQQLSVPDLTATGRVEGEFPLLLTPTTAIIENGVLHAAEGGGTIAYTGHAGDETEGVAQMAFGALRAFRYDSLGLELNGDLGGDIVSTINFSGRNQAAVSMEGLAPGGGLIPTTGASNIPFRFNVRVSAPFRRLAETAASFSDATTLIERARTPPLPPDLAEPNAQSPAPAEDEPSSAIDPPPSSPR